MSGQATNPIELIRFPLMVLGYDLQGGGHSLFAVADEAGTPMLPFFTSGETAEAYRMAYAGLGEPVRGLRVLVIDEPAAMLALLESVVIFGRVVWMALNPSPPIAEGEQPKALCYEVDELMSMFRSVGSSGTGQ